MFLFRLIIWVIVFFNIIIFSLVYSEDQHSSTIVVEFCAKKKLFGELDVSLIKQKLREIYVINSDGSLSIEQQAIKDYHSSADAFEMNDLPGFIFKTNQNCLLSTEEKEFFDHIAKPKVRFGNYLKCQKILEKQQLDKLLLPEAEFLELFLNDKILLEVVVERKIDLLTSSIEYSETETQKSIYQETYPEFEGNIELKKNFRELFLQFTIFVCLTKGWDLHDSNFPLHKEKNMIVILDVEDLFEQERFLNFVKDKEKFDIKLRKKIVDNPVFMGFYVLLKQAHPEFRNDMLETASKILAIKKEEMVKILMEIENEFIKGIMANDLKGLYVIDAVPTISQSFLNKSS